MPKKRTVLIRRDGKASNPIFNDLLCMDEHFKEIESVYPQQTNHFFFKEILDASQRAGRPELKESEFLQVAANDFERWLKEFFADCASEIINRKATEAASLTGVTVFTWNDVQMLRLLTKGFRIHAGSIRGGKSRAEFLKDAEMLKRRVYFARCQDVRKEHPNWPKSRVYGHTAKRLSKEGIRVSPRSLRRYVKIAPRTVE